MSKNAESVQKEGKLRQETERQLYYTGRYAGTVWAQEGRQETQEADRGQGD